MFLRIVSDSFTRKPRRKLLTAAALALGMAVATATLEVSLDVGDRLAREFRSLGANLLVTPASDTLPLEIGGVDYRPVDAGAYLPESDLGKLKTIFWRNNIVGFSPFLDVPVEITAGNAGKASREQLIGTWYKHSVEVPDGSKFTTGVSATNPWWRVDGRWFSDGAEEAAAGAGLARRLGLRIGSTVRIGAGDRARTLTITGIVSTGGREDNSILAPLEIAQDLAGRPSLAPIMIGRKKLPKTAGNPGITTVKKDHYYTMKSKKSIICLWSDDCSSRGDQLKFHKQTNGGPDGETSKG